MTDQLRMKAMSPDDVLGDALINRETQDFLWEIFVNSDACFDLFVKMMADGHNLDVCMSKNSLQSIVENAKHTDAILHEVRETLIQHLGDV